MTTSLTQPAPADDEQGRLAALRQLEILDTEPEEPFENVVSLVRTVLGVPIATVTLVDEDRQWFKARRGLDVSETPRDVSFCTHAIRQSEPFLVSDAQVHPLFAENPLVLGEPGIRSYAGIPLQTAEGFNVGTLCAIDVQPREFTEAEVALLSNFARIVVNEFELRRIAQRDQLTGALTRRGFLEMARHEIGRFRRYGRPSCLLLVDIDFFKQVNDTYGHPAGDAALKALAETVTLAKRPVDLLGRLGGEEFAVLLPETEAPDAFWAAERFRQAIEDRVIELADGRTVAVTASFGIAPLTDTVTSVEDWLSRADEPLYAAKHAGRNRCVVGGSS
ncbi:GGDEF domain-containing protein [Novosphingobium mathurense]|uniref:diguanylate cyclase n=1 Tax=Novosphingobium mathurense TaxID=428990 RepID=A0A1U6GTT1_9SPHN|nr:sensor domain-containing diguanylate cyclase [Novosphingobium mathurense]SLJ86830.1 diguanylate cyclase with GAF sensor [Novosphingobium mathurense]